MPSPCRNAGHGCTSFVGSAKPDVGSAKPKEGLGGGGRGGCGAAQTLLLAALCFIAPGVGRSQWTPPSSDPLTSPEGTFSDGSGDANYAPNLDLAWIIAPPFNGKELAITFTEFDVEAAVWYEDFVTVYSCESPACEQPELIANILEVGVVSSATGMAKIEFSSDGYLQKGGFTATWMLQCVAGTYLLNNSVAAGCGVCPANSTSQAGSSDSSACICDVGNAGPGGGARRARLANTLSSRDHTSA